MIRAALLPSVEGGASGSDWGPLCPGHAGGGGHCSVSRFPNRSLSSGPARPFARALASIDRLG
jgi:hypothetical protein